MKKTILLIDDDRDFLEIFSAKLQGDGADVTTAQGGEAGIAKIKELKPDLVLLDVEMPGINGVEVLAMIKENAELKNTKVAFLTSHGETNKREEWSDEKVAREVGAIDYIRKTDELNAIAGQVKDLLNATK